MHHTTSLLEIFRWGYVHLPGAVFFYARELDLDMEDVGILAAVFYAFENTKPLFQAGVRTGQILQCCSTLTTNKLSRKLNKLAKQQIIEVVDGSSKNFNEKVVLLDPLLLRLEQLVLRDHPKIKPVPEMSVPNEHSTALLEEYKARIEELELQLEGPRKQPVLKHMAGAEINYKKVADFIAKKTGNLLSVKMETELRKWLLEFRFTPEFLLCMLELAFERSITNPRDITRIARDLKEYSITTVDGLEVYFRNYVDQDKNHYIHAHQFDPDVAEFGNFTGLDMNAEARKKVYNKWRYDWGFTHPMIMKAGELMCQRTKNGGLEYIDSVLKSWMSKEIRTLSDVDKEISTFKSRQKTGAGLSPGGKNPVGKGSSGDYEFYVPPEVLAELKSKV